MQKKRFALSTSEQQLTRLSFVDCLYTMASTALHALNTTLHALDPMTKYPMWTTTSWKGERGGSTVPKGGRGESAVPGGQWYRGEMEVDGRLSPTVINP